MWLLSSHRGIIFYGQCLCWPETKQGLVWNVSQAVTRPELSRKHSKTAKMLPSFPVQVVSLTASLLLGFLMDFSSIWLLYFGVNHTNLWSGASSNHLLYSIFLRWVPEQHKQSVTLVPLIMANECCFFLKHSRKQTQSQTSNISGYCLFFIAFYISAKFNL